MSANKSRRGNNFDLARPSKLRGICSSIKMRCMTRSNDRQSRALRRQEKHLDGVDVAWKKWKTCDVCGNHFCVNCGWEDRKPRTPKYQGFVICPNCDPREYDPHYPFLGDQIRRTRRGRFCYRVVMMMVVIRILAKRDCERFEDKSNCKCLPCTARKIERIRP